MGCDENEEMLTSYRAKETQLGENYFNFFSYENQYAGSQMLRDTFSEGSWVCKLEVQTALGVPGKRPRCADSLHNRGPGDLYGPLLCKESYTS